jgi:hypothetical protein
MNHRTVPGLASDPIRFVPASRTGLSRACRSILGQEQYSIRGRGASRQMGGDRGGHEPVASIFCVFLVDYWVCVPVAPPSVWFLGE